MMQNTETSAAPTVETRSDRAPRPDIGGQWQTGSSVTPEQLVSEFPISDAAAIQVRSHRLAIQQALFGAADRLLVVVGPCSIHDAEAGIVYMDLLAELARELSEDLLIVARVYLEKPRTAIGWTGMLSDPALDGSSDLGQGLRSSRALMAQVAERGLAIATEWLSPALPHYLADLVSWGAIGARTVESQVHRQMASGLPMPIGMKNSVTGSVKVAVDAIRFASQPHTYISHGPHGQCAALRTTGNTDCHLVLRGSSDRPNYGTDDIQEAVDMLAAAGLPDGLVIDASHGNSGKDHERQALVAQEIGSLIARGNSRIRGVMLESFLVGGRQEIGSENLVFGQSVTDACMGWDTTAAVLRGLAQSARRRKASSDNSGGARTSDFSDLGEDHSSLCGSAR